MDIRKEKRDYILYIDNQPAAKIYQSGGYELKVTYKKIRGKSLLNALDKVEDMMPMGRKGISLGDSPIWDSTFTILGKKEITDEEIKKIFSVVEKELEEPMKENTQIKREAFRESIYHKQFKHLIESINKSLISEIKETYNNYVSDLSSTTASDLITINFTISGAGTSFEEVEGDMDNIAEAYGMLVSDFSSFCEEGQDIDCDEYLRTGQPVEFCVSFEYLDK